MVSESTLTYFAHRRSGLEYQGALVTITAEGDPIEFVYTDPVALSRLSKALLGPRVESYMVVRVLLPPLLALLGSTPQLLCFDEPRLLLRRWDAQVTAAVFAAIDSAHKPGRWTLLDPRRTDLAEAVWLSSAQDGIAHVLQQARTGMAPFGLCEPFGQVRAALDELQPGARK